ncbi:MAG: chalcone isomerase family protein [Gemmataceae bacterium]
MKQMRLFSALLLLVCIGRTHAVELVGVPGSGTHYTTTMDISIGGKPVHLVLTGVALRQKLFFNVYTLGSYVLEGAALHTAEDLAALDRPKQLHLVMERDVAGGDIAEAFSVAIRQNYPTPNFNEEVNRLVEVMREIEFKKGDHIYLTHQPGIGLRCQVIGKGDFTIENPDFSRAIWDIYLGKNNIGDGIKKGLVSRLK